VFADSPPYRDKESCRCLCAFFVRRFIRTLHFGNINDRRLADLANNNDKKQRTRSSITNGWHEDVEKRDI
jgi:hypothetical protein